MNVCRWWNCTNRWIQWNRMCSGLNDGRFVGGWWVFNYRWWFTTTLMLITLSTWEIDDISILYSSFTWTFIFVRYRFNCEKEKYWLNNSVVSSDQCWIERKTSWFSSLVNYTLSFFWSVSSVWSKHKYYSRHFLPLFLNRREIVISILVWRCNFRSFFRCAQ